MSAPPPEPVEDQLRRALTAASASALGRVVGLIKARWVCEQAHQQMKEELSLDHFEGRNWHGLHLLKHMDGLSDDAVPASSTAPTSSCSAAKATSSTPCRSTAPR